VLISTYRSLATQRSLFNNRVQRFVDEGMLPAEADAAARRVVAYPGTSEHNLGLGADIVCSTYHGLSAAQANTPVGRWLAANSYRYGFVLRYPDHKQHITHIIFEPWHFRYVGVDAAREMFERDLVLEEYVSERIWLLQRQ
jgi:D-alanyl-D-alanine carboxypeptidase